MKKIKKLTKHFATSAHWNEYIIVHDTQGKVTPVVYDYNGLTLTATYAPGGINEI